MTPEQEFANKILEMTPEQFNEWADKSSLEEVAYATNMIMVANQQLREEMECMQEEQEYYLEQELNDMSYDACGFEDARQVLSKFTLNGL
jgi:hypothetical protein